MPLVFSEPVWQPITDTAERLAEDVCRGVWETTGQPLLDGVQAGPRASISGPDAHATTPDPDTLSPARRAGRALGMSAAIAAVVTYEVGQATWQAERVVWRRPVLGVISNAVAAVALYKTAQYTGQQLL